MKAYLHARLSRDERVLLDDLKAATGQSESALVRQGLRLVHDAIGARPSALDLAGPSAGKFARGPRTLSSDRAHLDGFGE